jgi:hypothetical protein
MQQGYCAGFLDALTTRLNMTGAICSPEGSTLGAAILSFQKWAADNPDQWQINAQLGVEAALKSTWPCK